MRTIAALLAVILLAAGCASAAPPRRGDALRTMLAASVQLRSEREGGGRRSGSGVVVASDAASRRSWIVTTRHFLEPSLPQRVTLTRSARGTHATEVEVVAVSAEVDLALVAVDGLVLPPARLQDDVALGAEVRVVGYPWGRRLTVVSGIVSAIASAAGEVPVEGAVRVIDASVSYGASGAGVFDAATGALIGIVEGYRTARVALPTGPDATFELPVAGETTVVAVPLIRRFLEQAGAAEGR